MEKKIKSESDFIKNVLYIITEKQKLSLPPTLDDIKNAYSTGVLVSLYTVSNLMHGFPLDGSMKEAIDKDSLMQLIEKLELTKDFQELQNGSN